MDGKGNSPDQDFQAQPAKPGEDAALELLPGGTITFLFTDIEGSTRLLEQLREQYSQVLSEQRDLLRAAFVNWNGHEIDTQGDSFFVAFTRACDAIACVIEAQKSLASHPWPQGVTVRVRMGLHTGEPMVARTGYVGMDVHRAARVAAAGHGGQVLLSQTTRDLIYQELPPGSCLRFLGEFKLKDIRFPQAIFQLEMDGMPCDFPPLKTMSLAEEPPTPGMPPFKGLQYFEEADASLFFGRAQVTARLVETVKAERFQAVIGASGSGKSSVVRAGLVPALKHSQPGAWEVFVLTPTARPLEALSIHLTRGSESMTAAATLLDDLRREPRSLYLYALKHGEKEKQWLVVVDQFEELFTLCREEGDRRAFIENLLCAADAVDGNVHVLLTLRADFYDHLAEYPGLRDAVARHQEYLGAMSADELREAIEEPAKLGGWEFAPGLVELMLHEIGAEGGRQPEPGALPLLSHALLETWNHRRGNLMNLKSYGEAGGVNRAIARTAERLYMQELTPPQQEIARSIFLRLTELGEGTQDTRRRAAIRELFPAEPHGDPKDVEEVLVKLADARLIITGEGTAEVAHEALIREWPTLREWLKDNREGLLVQRRLTEAAQEWQLLERDPSALYRGVRLAQVVEWTQAHPQQLNAQEQAFLDASQAEAQREETEREAQRQHELETARQLAETEKSRAEAERQRAEEQARSAKRLRRRAVYLALALLAALAMVILAVIFARRASDSADLAEKNLALAEIASTQAVSHAATAQSAGELAIAEAKTRATAEADAIEQKQIAESQKQLAQAREWAAASTSNLAVDPERSILLAMQAVKTVDIPEAEQALHNALLASRLRDSIKGHSDYAYGVVFHPDGKRFATISKDGTVKVWAFDREKLKINPTPLITVSNPIDYEPTAQTSGHTIEFSPDGTQLAAVVANHVVNIWDPETGKLLRTLTGHTDAVCALAYSPDGSLLATASNDLTARVWDAHTGELLQTIQHISEVYDVTFRPDSKQLVTMNVPDDLLVWDRTGQGKPAFTLAYKINTHQGNPMRFLFSPDQKQLASALFEIKIYDLAGASTASPPRQILTLLGHKEGNSGIIYSPDGSILYSGSVDGTVKAWDTVTGQEIYSLGANAGSNTGISLSPDGSTLLAVYTDSTIKVWDLTITGNREWLSIGPRDRGLLRMISADGKYLATIANWGGDQLFHVWELSTDGTKEKAAYPINSEILHSFFPATDQKFTRLAIYYSRTNTIEVRDVMTGNIQKTIIVPQEFSPYEGTISPDGSLYAIGCTDGTIYIWNLEKEMLQLTLKGHTGVINSLEFSPDGTRIASGSEDGSARIWDIKQGQQVMKLESNSPTYSRISYSSDGKRLLVPNGNNAVLYDLQTGQSILTVPSPGGNGTYTDISPDGRYLAVSGSNSIIAIYDSGTGKEFLDFPGSFVIFTPDSKHLITGTLVDPQGVNERGFFLDISDVMRLARSRLTRTWTLEECQKFLHMDTCPPTP